MNVLLALTAVSITLVVAIHLGAIIVLVILDFKEMELRTAQVKF